MHTTMRSRTKQALRCALMVLATSGCVDPSLTPGETESTGTSPATDSATTDRPTTGPNDSSGSIDPSTTIGSASASTDDATNGDDPGASFVPPDPDVGGPYECDIWLQDCPSGEKCMPWIEEEGSSGGWNATRCSPVVDDPAAPGEPCHYEGWPGSGIDDCELGAMCWDVDGRTNEGVCRGICLGMFEAYYCENPDEWCMEGGDGLITLCLPVCDPLAQDCPEGQTCAPVQLTWECAPDASRTTGAYGDPCEFPNACDPGLICLDSSTQPPGLPCENAAGCCTEVCDITSPLGDQQCAGVAEGQTCQPWYEDGEGPVVVQHVGACMLPQ